MESCHLKHSELAEHLLKTKGEPCFEEAMSKATQDAKQSSLNKEHPHLK